MSGETSTVGPGPASIQDARLLSAARSGDCSAMAALWSAYVPSAVRYAWTFSGASDAEDIVSEACTRIWAALSVGKGPSVAFRPYLYATIRNVAASRATQERTLPGFVWDNFVHPHSTESNAVKGWDAHAVRSAFASLPFRYQELLWGTLVEDVPATVLAAKAGVTPNALAAMASRAREALRLAWIQAHVTTTDTVGEHRWALGCAGRAIRNALSPRDRSRFVEHLNDCNICLHIVGEVALDSRADLMRHPAAIVPQGNVQSN